MFALLDAELAGKEAVGEVYLVGGAVVCTALGPGARPRMWMPYSGQRGWSGRRPYAKTGVDPAWLNDAVKGYLGPRGEYEPFLDLPHLRVFVAHPRYLLAMKCASMRLGREFHDLDDVRYHLNIESPDEALEIVLAYFDEAQLVPKTRLVLEDCSGRADGQGRG